MNALTEMLVRLAAARQHTVFIGEPGCGKTLLAKRLAELIQREPMTVTEKMAHVMTWARAGMLRVDVTGDTPVLLPIRRPLRAPHHTVSRKALVGSWCRCGAWKYGEAMLANGGVLLLDEIEEFQRSALEALVEPIASSHIRYGGAAMEARWILLATANDEAAYDRRVPEQLHLRLHRVAVTRKEAMQAAEELLPLVEVKP